jgi:hypothetical protein
MCTKAGLNACAHWVISISDVELFAVLGKCGQQHDLCLSSQNKAIIGIDERLQTLTMADKLEGVPTVEMPTCSRKPRRESLLLSEAEGIS